MKYTEEELKEYNIYKYQEGSGFLSNLATFNPYVTVSKFIFKNFFNDNEKIIKGVKLNKRERMMALFSNHVYESPNNRKNKYNGYELNNKINNNTECVYHNMKKKEVLFCIRGTSVTSLKDFINDLGITQGTQRSEKRYKDTYQLLRQIKNMYQGFNIVVLGHSLGANLTSYMFEKDKSLEIYMFNAGSGPHDNIQKRLYEDSKKNRSKYRKVHEYHIKNDLISAIPMYYGRKVFEISAVNKHSMINFL